MDPAAYITANKRHYKKFRVIMLDNDSLGSRVVSSSSSSSCPAKGFSQFCIIIDFEISFKTGLV